MRYALRDRIQRPRARSKSLCRIVTLWLKGSNTFDVILWYNSSKLDISIVRPCRSKYMFIRFLFFWRKLRGKNQIRMQRVFISSLAIHLSISRLSRSNGCIRLSGCEEYRIPILKMNVREYMRIQFTRFVYNFNAYICESAGHGGVLSKWFMRLDAYMHGNWTARNDCVKQTKKISTTRDFRVWLKYDLINDDLHISLRVEDIKIYARIDR